MADIETLLSATGNRQALLGQRRLQRIRAHEAQASAGAPAGLRWQGVTALIRRHSAGLRRALSRTDELGPGARYALVIAMVAVFTLRRRRSSLRSVDLLLHAVGNCRGWRSHRARRPDLQHPATTCRVHPLFAGRCSAIRRKTLALLLVPRFLRSLGFRINGDIGEGI